jgi:hypothetical protein
MEVPQEFVDKVVEVYYPNYRYLKSADIDFPIAKGRFQLGQTEYMETLQHVTDIEAQLCLNQLAYVFFGNEIVNGRWPESGNISFDKFMALRKENMFIVESKKKFRRETDPRIPFSGHIELKRIKKQRDIYVAKIDFDLNEKACMGELSLVLKV